MTEILVQAATEGQVPRRPVVWSTRHGPCSRMPWSRSGHGSRRTDRSTSTPRAPAAGRRRGGRRACRGRGRAALPAPPARQRLPRGAREGPPPLGRGRFPGAGLPGLLLAFQPAANRAHGLQHLVVFPMYTQNGNPDRNLEAVMLRMVWPEVAGRAGAHPLRQPAVLRHHLRGLHSGYDTNSAVLFRRRSPSARRRNVSPGVASSATARPRASAA
ncbi:DUF6421 family protein [Streptomyces tricolor]|nr:DUF6421 family protein [Streptomyces tricolor]